MSLRGSARLYLGLDESENFVADIQGYDNNTYKLAVDIAAGLAAKSRFAGQLRCRHYSVLHHTHLVGRCAEHLELPNDVVRQAYLHDVGEAFFVDIPTPIKTAHDKQREDAIVKAISNLLSYDIEEKCDDLAVIDTVAALVEASVLGFPSEWTWVQKELMELDYLGKKACSFMWSYLLQSGWFQTNKEAAITYFSENIEVDTFAINKLVNDFPTVLQRLEVI